MQKQGFFLEHIVDGSFKKIFDGISGRIFLNDMFGFFCYHIFNERRDIMKIIVECIPVDAAVSYNVFHFDLGQRALV